MKKNLLSKFLCLALVHIFVASCNSPKPSKQKVADEAQSLSNNVEVTKAISEDIAYKEIVPANHDKIESERNDKLSTTEEFITDYPLMQRKIEIEHSPEEITITESFTGVVKTACIAVSDACGSATSFPVSPSSEFIPATISTEFTPTVSSMYTEYVSSVESSEGASSHVANIDAAHAGQITAGEINDFQKWKMWEDIGNDELRAYKENWTISPDGRYTVMVQNKNGNPVIDAQVDLIDKDGLIIWTSRTDNTGKAELWSELSTVQKKNKPDYISVIHSGEKKKINDPIEREQGVNQVKLNTSCDVSEIMELVFTVDATGSMQDEISYLQAELLDVMAKIRSLHPEMQLNLGSVFYRDHGDTYVTKTSDLSSDISKTNSFISNQYADGGGDGPEAVDDAVEASLKEISWSAEARTRIMFLILDAPPHQENANIQKLLKSMKMASSKGVRIVPLVASGGGYDLDKSLEYLMRCFALSTNGTYVFLTDHSGIGEQHTAPTTDKFEVEKLNDLLVRVIEQFAYAPSCSMEEFIAAEEPIDTAITSTYYTIPADTLSAAVDSTDLYPIASLFVIKCYPNPASNYVMIQTSELVDEIYLADNAGKIIQKLSPTDVLTRLDLTGYPSGLYHLKAWLDERWASVRIVVAHI